MMLSSHNVFRIGTFLWLCCMKAWAFAPPSQSYPSLLDVTHAQAPIPAPLVVAPSSSLDRPVTALAERPDNNADDPIDAEGGTGDWFTIVLLGYVVFAVSDSIFHFVPNDKSYGEMLLNAITGN